MTEAEAPSTRRDGALLGDQEPIVHAKGTVEPYRVGGDRCRDLLVDVGLAHARVGTQSLDPSPDRSGMPADRDRNERNPG